VFEAAYLKVIVIVLGIYWINAVFVMVVVSLKVNVTVTETKKMIAVYVVERVLFMEMMRIVVQLILMTAMLTQIMTVSRIVSATGVVKQ
jgi:hypothetical protein